MTKPTPRYSVCTPTNNPDFWDTILDTNDREHALAEARRGRGEGLGTHTFDWTLPWPDSRIDGYAGVGA